MTPTEARAIFMLLDLIDDARCTADVAVLKSCVRRLLSILVRAD